MRVRFWGTRGSFAKPGPTTLRYGGNTSCVEVVSDSGTLVVIDCGTGVQGLGQMLLAERSAPRSGHVLISHTHWDHIQGFPFFAPLFVPGDEWDIYGPRALGTSLRDTLAGQMQYNYFPVPLEALGAATRYHSLVEGEFAVGDIRIRTRYLNHPVLTLAYRLEADGAVLVHASDHEPHDRRAATGDVPLAGEDAAHAEFVSGADLLIHDAQYTAAEYPKRVGWGHSTVEYAVRVAQAAGVARLALTHHDPGRDDDAIDAVVAEARTALAGGSGLDVFGATEGSVYELSGSTSGDAAHRDSGEATAVSGLPQASSALRDDSALSGHRVLVALEAAPAREVIVGVCEADGLDLIDCAPNAVAETVAREAPSLVLVDGDSAGLVAARAIRALEGDHATDLPVAAVADHIGDETAVTDWLVTPFSPEYARTRARAWLLRTPARWVTAPRSARESERLEAVRGLGLLDTGREERFDRITRLATRVLGAPVSMVSLVDENRQWFKSITGYDLRETPREMSFCAHAILGEEPMVVPDLLADDRFADNPLVAGPPHVRFYAGCPLELPDGHRVGTLCVVDLEARELTEEQVEALRDLADLAEEELTRGAGP